MAKNQVISSKLEEANDYIEESNQDEGQETLNVDPNIKTLIKGKVVKAFRVVKFVNNDAGMLEFSDMIMDMMGDRNITHDPKDSKRDKLQAEENRKIYRRTYVKWMRHCLNEHRNGVQVMSTADFSTNMYILLTSPPFLGLVTSLLELIAQVCS